MPKRARSAVGFLLLAGALCLVTGTGLAQSGVSWSQIMDLPQPPAGQVMAYGDAPSQFGELRLPEGEGPFPVAVLIHGGCWQRHYGADHIAPLAADLNEHGVATWAIEYRRLGEPGGGWPGTFDDVVVGLAQLETIAGNYPVDAGRMVLVGHSAGGHLALWLASRERIVTDHRWRGGVPDGLQGVVGLAAITDLAEYAAGKGDCNAAVPMLLGDDGSRYADRLGLASPDRLMPPAVPVHLVHGREDRIVPLSQTVVYVNNVNRAGGSARETLVAGAGHFDPIAPFSEAWARARGVILGLLEETGQQEETGQ
ncbi:alpha/beta hydrolase family protein [Wenzhouxiangella sediminis]|uniref:Alpha/beta hydrolase n=1 Tax=Wenzhouxiangella sediminis TaxID=1792836 RepID=A0A3E1K9M3_9GAMM|nr:alpha/beta hydrolase [Wenzhouxiangella sediminis]RFF30871.1 alpha/beta hydrolase [Wenzhouxiangella sediminis]